MQQQRSGSPGVSMLAGKALRYAVILASFEGVATLF